MPPLPCFDIFTSVDSRSWRMAFTIFGNTCRSVLGNILFFTDIVGDILKKTIYPMLKFMSISPTISVKKSIFPSTDLHVLPKMVNAILQDLESTDVKMSKHGNGGMQMRSINNMLQVFYLQLIEESLTLVTPSGSSFGPTRAISDMPLLSKSTVPINKLLLKL
jgi:hypothetical protein